MIKVTFGSQYKVKEGRKWVSKESEFVEFFKSESDARLRAMALNWFVIKIENV